MQVDSEAANSRWTRLRASLRERAIFVAVSALIFGVLSVIGFFRRELIPLVIFKAPRPLQLALFHYMAWDTKAVNPFILAVFDFKSRESGEENLRRAFEGFPRELGDHCLATVNKNILESQGEWPSAEWLSKSELRVFQEFVELLHHLRRDFGAQNQTEAEFWDQYCRQILTLYIQRWQPGARRINGDEVNLLHSVVLLRNRLDLIHTMVKRAEALDSTAIGTVELMIRNQPVLEDIDADMPILLNLIEACDTLVHQSPDGVASDESEAFFELREELYAFYFRFCLEEGERS